MAVESRISEKDQSALAIQQNHWLNHEADESLTQASILMLNFEKNANKKHLVN